MSLGCSAHRSHDMMVGDSIYVANIPGKALSVPFCEDALRLIPESERHADELPNGVNIHLGGAQPLPGTIAYTWASLALGRRLFSINRQTLLRYLPGVAQLLLG